MVLNIPRAATATPYIKICKSFLEPRKKWKCTHHKSPNFKFQNLQQKNQILEPNESKLMIPILIVAANSDKEK